MSYKVLLIAGALAIPPAHALADEKQEPPVKVAPAATVGQPNPTPEDYWRPLDSWLKLQGSPLSGKDFYEVAQQYHLDPDFLIAVTKAETNLGKVQQRGSSCNVGSVGSYDSTATTFACSSYRHGIEQIAQTVNNPLLSRYWRVSELSRSHNPNQNPIYASSNGNWYRNVVGTMNQLKGKDLPDYAFRK